MEKDARIFIIPKIIFFWYITIFISTEALSLLNLIDRSSVLSVNILFLIIIVVFFGKGLRMLFYSFLRAGKIQFFIISVILGLTFLQGFLSAPNTTDSMVRRLPIVMYWVQEQTLYQDTIRNGHDFMGPFSEYILLHLYLIFNSDRMLFFSQWLAFVATIVLSFRITRLLSVSSKMAAYVSLLVASLPIAVLQATSVQMDMVTTVMVLFSLYFAFIFKERPSFRNVLYLSFAIGLGILTKATYLIYVIFPVGIALSVIADKKYLSFLPKEWKKFLIMGIASILLIGIIQVRFIEQNLRLFGSISGEKGKSVYMNELITPQVIFSNLIRNLTVQLPFPVGKEVVEKGVDLIHEKIGISIDDSRINFFDVKFSVNPIIFPQEDRSGNPIHVMLIFMSGLFLMFKGNKLRKIPTVIYLYILSITSFFLFSAILKWQPFHSRLLMPFFIVGSIASVVILLQFKSWEKFLKIAIAGSVGLAFVLIVLNVSKPFLSYQPIYSYVKSLAPSLSAVPESIFTKKREKQYFNARYYWYKPYKEVMQKIEKNRWGTITFKLMDEFEYPLWYFLKKYEIPLEVIPYAEKTINTIIISTSKDPYSTKGYLSECIKTEISYGYACLLLPDKLN